MSEKKGELEARPDVAEVRRVLERAEKGDATVLPALRKLLERPGLREVYGNLARLADRSLIEALGTDNLAFKEGLASKLEVLRAELAGPDATPLERLLAERIATCWLHVNDAEVRNAQAKGLTIEAGDYHQRRLDRAHKRYLSALKTLALVRKLAVPVLQVNIARKQVNVAGPCVAAGNGKDSA